MGPEEGLGGSAAAWTPLHPLASCAALAGCAADPAALAGEVRALVVEAARLHQTPGGSPWHPQQQQHGDGGAGSVTELSPAQRLRLVVNAAAELSNLTATLSAVEAAVALHPGSLPQILQALHDGPRRALPLAIAALARSLGSAVDQQQQQQQQQQQNYQQQQYATCSLDPTDPQAVHLPLPTRHTPALARVRGTWEADEAASAAGRLAVVPTAAAGPSQFFSPRDPRAARLARLSGDPASVGTPPAPHGSPAPDQYQAWHPQEVRREGPEAAAVAAAGVFSGLTAADVLLLLMLRGRGPVNDELIAVALCSAVQGTSREGLSVAVSSLSDLSDEAVEWVFGVALAWLGTVVVDLPSLEAAGRHLLAAALGATPDTCRMGLRLLLQRLQSEACVEGPLWGALEDLAAATAAAIDARDPQRPGQQQQLQQLQQQASPQLAPEVADAAAGELLSFVSARLMALPPGVAARLVEAVAPLVGPLPHLAAMLCRASVEALSQAAVRRAGLLVKPEAGAEEASPGKGRRDAAATRGPSKAAVERNGTGPASGVDEDDGLDGDGAGPGDELSQQLARARRVLNPAGARAGSAARSGVAADSEEGLALACAKALLAHGRGGAWVGPPAADAAAPQVMVRWLQDSPPSLLTQLLAVEPSVDLATSWQSALLAGLGRLVGPAAGGGALHAPSPTWLTLPPAGLPPGADPSLPPPVLEVPAAPALLAAVLRSVAPAGNGSSADASLPAGGVDQELRLPTDPDELARCGLRLCAILLQAVGDSSCGDSGVDGGGDWRATGRDGAARRAALLLARVRVLGVLHRTLLACPALGVLLALMHSAGPHTNGGDGRAGACGAALDGAACSGPACAALAQVERAAAAADGGGWWEQQRAEQLLVPLQVLLCSETERLAGLAAAAVKEVLDGPSGLPLGTPAAGAAPAGVSGCDRERQGSEGEECGDAHQDQPRRQRRPPDASGFVVIWSTPGGTAAATTPGGGPLPGSMAAPAAAAALGTLPPWLLQPLEPLPAAGLRQLLALAARQMRTAAEDAAVVHAGPSAAGAALNTAVQAARAALSAAARTLSVRPLDATHAAGVAAACYTFHRAIVETLAAVGAAPPLEDGVGAGGQAGSSSATPSGRACRRSSTAAATPIAAAAGVGPVAAADGLLLALAGEALDLCARATTATASVCNRQGGDNSAANGGLSPGATHLLGELLEGLSPEAGRVAAAIAALKQMQGRGVSMGTNNYHAAKRGAVAHPLLAARLAVVRQAQRLAQWQAAREAAGASSEEGSEAAATPCPAAPLLQGWLELQHALSCAWAADRAAACGPDNGPRAVIPSEADAMRCEALIGDLLDGLALGESLPASLVTPSAARRLARAAAYGAVGARPVVAVLLVHNAVLRHGEVAYAPRLGRVWAALGAAPPWLRRAGPDAARASVAVAAEQLTEALERHNAGQGPAGPGAGHVAGIGAAGSGSSKPLPRQSLLVLVAAALEACAYLAGCGRIHGSGHGGEASRAAAPQPAHLDLAARILLALTSDKGPCATASAALLADVSAPPGTAAEQSGDRHARREARARKALGARLVALGKSACAAARRLLEQHPGGGGSARRGGPPPAAWAALPQAAQRLRTLNGRLQEAVNSAGDGGEEGGLSVGVVVRTHLQVALEECASLPAREAARMEADEAAKGGSDYGFGSEEEGSGSDTSGSDDGKEPEVRETLLPGLLLGFGSDSDSESGSQVSGSGDGDGGASDGGGAKQRRGGWGPRQTDEAAQQERLKLLLGPSAVLRPPPQKKAQSAPLRPKAAAEVAPSPLPEPGTSGGRGAAGPLAKQPDVAPAPERRQKGAPATSPAIPAAAAPTVSAPPSGGGGVAAAALMAARAAASGRNSSGIGATPSRSMQPPLPPQQQQQQQQHQQQAPSTPLPSLPGIPTPGRGQEVRRTAGSGKGSAKGGGAKRAAAGAPGSAAGTGGSTAPPRPLPPRDSSGRFLASGGSGAGKRPATTAAAGQSGGSKRSKPTGAPRSSGAKAPRPPALDANSSNDEGAGGSGGSGGSGGDGGGDGQRGRSSRRGTGAAPRNPFMAAVLAMEPPRRGKPGKRARRDDSGSAQDQRSGGDAAGDDSASLELTSDDASDTFSDLEDFVVCEPGRDYLGLIAAKDRARARQQRGLAGGGG